MNAATVRPAVPAARIIGLTALAALAALTTAVPGHASVRDRVVRTNEVHEGPLAVSVRIKGGTTPLYQAARRGDRWYLEAREGAKYEVRVRNTTGERVGFLIAVDGLNAINGQRSSLNPHEPLYVLEPYATTTVKGWRKNLGNVSRFVFVDEERSYAERTGQANGEMGWIRVIAFREDLPIVDRDQILGMDESGRRSSTRKESREGDSRAEEPEAGAMGAPTAPPTAQRGTPTPYSTDGAKDENSSPGTGWGANERDRARYVDFEPQSWAAATITLRYEYRPALLSLGILPYRNWNASRLWERENGTVGFAQPPSR
jgi:hypothetical protein